MLVTQGDRRGFDIDRRLACTLAAVAGALNAAAFQAVGFFSANMTGNVSAGSDRLALGNWPAAGFYLSVVVAFILGSATASLMINAGRRRRMRGIYALAILTEAILLTVLGAAVLWSPLAGRGALLIIGLASLMGLQNAVVTRISDARVRTTHISGLVTDIGVELGMLLDIALGREPAAEAPPYRQKLMLHGLTLIAFLAGGVAGALAYRAVADLVVFAAAAVLMVLAINGLIRAGSGSSEEVEA